MSRFPYALLLFDLDYFKQVNDQFGHANGDAILKQFAELLLFNTRTSDFAFRYGGEEFLVIMGNADQATALAQAERIRQNCADFNFAVSTIHTIHVTCSAGIAVYDGHPDPNQLLSSADRALYQAKEQGRNRVC